jgi:protein-S-isoprenylcysteine O-methyltransferase Ste14
MNEYTVLNALIIGWFVLAGGVFLALFFVTAPYGRHARKGWGPGFTNRVAWVVMEAPAPLLFALFFALGEHHASPTAWVFLALWQAHYFHRAFIYPFRLRGSEKRMPIVIVASGLVFNGVNGYLNGRYLFTFSGGYPTAWLWDPRFAIGLGLFVVGFVINRQADQMLRSLRGPEEMDYKVPHGGLYSWISCPNYFGEILEWVGWAVATWSFAGLAFATWTAANLIPRARAHHLWYREAFPDYPPERKALVPRLW